jgi:hypothetical protein
MMTLELQKRHKDLQRVCQELSGSSVEYVHFEEVTRKNGEAVVNFNHSVRIRSAGLRFTIWEQFIDLDTDPHLYAFKYHVAKEQDVLADKPLFRYECHPDVGSEKKHINKEGEFKSPYETEAHFHPDSIIGENLRKLHYPFHRNERKTVVFALVQWLRVDLVRRFHHV